MPARRPSTPPAPTHRFATREAHAATLDEAALVGPQPGISHDDLLRHCRTRPPSCSPLRGAWASDAWDGFAEILLARGDPRAPWRSNTGLVADIPGLGFLLIQGCGPMAGGKAVLLRPDPPHIQEHTLAHSRSGQPVHFNDRREAVSALRPVVLGGGALPAEWAWSPLLDAPGDGWTLLPSGTADFAEFSWRGRSRWIITVTRFRVTAARNRKRVLDAKGQIREFESVRAAKWYCEGIDKE